MSITREDYEFEREGYVSILNEDGARVTCLSSLKSSWNYFKPGNETTITEGLLILRGDVTIINPDDRSPVAMLNSQIDFHLWLQAQQWSIVEDGEAVVVAFPRNPNSVDRKSGAGNFMAALRSDFPTALFTQPLPQYALSHVRAFGAKHWKEAIKTVGLSGIITPGQELYGLPVIKVNRWGTDKKLLDQFEQASVISEDHQVRKVIADQVRTLMTVDSGGPSLLPKAPEPLPSG